MEFIAFSYGKTTSRLDPRHVVMSRWEKREREKKR